LAAVVAAVGEAFRTVNIGMTPMRSGTSPHVCFGSVQSTVRGRDDQHYNCRFYDKTAGRKLLQDVYRNCVMAIYRLRTSHIPTTVPALFYFILLCFIYLPFAMDGGNAGMVTLTFIRLEFWPITYLVRYDILMATIMKLVIFWVIVPCNLVVYRRFRGSCCLDQQVDDS
jgi:hypothetical protein